MLICSNGVQAAGVSSTKNYPHIGQKGFQKAGLCHLQRLSDNTLKWYGKNQTKSKVLVDIVSLLFTNYFVLWTVSSNMIYHLLFICILVHGLVYECQVLSKLNKICYTHILNRYLHAKGDRLQKWMPSFLSLFMLQVSLYRVELNGLCYY